MATQNIYVDADATPNGWTPNSGSNAHYTYVDNDSTSEYLLTQDVDMAESFGTDYNNQVGSGDTINNVTVYVKAKKLGGGTHQIKITIRNASSAVTYSASKTLTTSWATYSNSFTSKPGGGTWSESDLDTLEIGFESITTEKGYGCQAAYIYAIINYTPTSATELTTRLGMILTGRKTVAARIANSVMRRQTSKARLAHNAITAVRSTTRLANALAFEGVSSILIYRPQDDDVVGGFTAVPSGDLYEQLDEESADGDTTRIYKTNPSIGDYFAVKVTDSYTIPNDAAVRIRFTARWDIANVDVKPFLRKASTNYYGDAVDITSSYVEFSYKWSNTPWGGSWGNINAFSFGLEVTSGSPVNQLRVTQIYLEIWLPITNTIRIPHAISRIATAKYRINMIAPLKEWTTPTWWDEDYTKRREISMGTSHSALSSGDQISFELQTGFEERLSSQNGVMNESIQHNGSQIVEYGDYIVVAWLAQTTATGVYSIRAQRYNRVTGVWSDEVTVSATTTYSDTHYYPTLLVDGSGYLHVFYGAHDSDLKYRRSVNTINHANNLSFGSEISVTAGDDVTYPRPIMDSSGNLYVFCRRIQDGARKQWVYFKSTSGGAEWGSAQVVVEYNDYVAAPSMYCGGCVYQNGRVHLALTFWDYYGSLNRGRAIVYIWSSDFSSWYYADGTAACTTNSAPLDYNDVDNANQFTIKSPNWGVSGPYYHTNTEALAVDPYNRVYFTYQGWNDYIGEKCNLYLAIWDGTSWTNTNLSGLTDAPQMFRYRQGGQLYWDNTVLYIYSFVLPETETEEYHGGELYCWRGTQNGTNWSHYYLTKNTSYGAGMISAMKSVSSYGRYLFYARARELFIFLDNTYPYIRNDGNDVRIVRHDVFGGTQEYDRLPDRFNALDTLITFKIDKGIPTNFDNHAYYRWFVYYSKYNASDAPHDVNDVFTLYDSFESLSAGAYLDTSDDWSGTANVFRVLAWWSMNIWANAHTNKLYAGSKFLYCMSNQAGNYNQRNIDIDSHYVQIQMWREGSGNASIALYNSSTGYEFRVGLGSANYRYKFHSSNWYYPGVSSSRTGRYYKILIRINSNGVSAWGQDGDVIVLDSPYMTSANAIRIYCDESSMSMCIDELKIWKWHSDDPEPTLEDAEGEDTPATTRFAHIADMRYHRSTRIGHLAKVKKFESLRIAHNIAGNKTSVQRLSEFAHLSKTDKARLPQLIVGDKEEVTRLAHSAATAKFDSVRIANISRLEATAVARIMQNISGDKHAVARLAHYIEPEITALVRLAMISNLNKTQFSRIMNSLGLDAVDTERIANIIAGNKVVAIRMAHDASSAKFDSARLMQYLQLEKTTVARIMNLIVGDKYKSTRFAHDVIVEATALSKIAMTLDGDKTLTTRMMHDLELDDEDIERIAHDMNCDKVSIIRLMNICVLEDTDIARLSHEVNLAYERVIRIVHMLAVDKVATLRMAMEAPVTPYGIERIANIVQVEDTEWLRIMHDVVPDKEVVRRLAQYLQSDKHLTARIAHITNLRTTDSERIAHRIMTDKTLGVRIGHDVDVDKEVIGRLAHIARLQAEYIIRLGSWCSLKATGVLRLASLLNLDKFNSARLAHSLDFVGDVEIRLAHLVDTNKIVSIRLPQYVSLLSSITTRIAMSVDADKELIARLNHVMNLESVLTTRISEIVELEKVMQYRMMHELDLEYATTARLAHLLNVIVTSYNRIAHKAPFYYLALVGVQYLNYNVDVYQCDDVGIKVFDICDYNINTYVVENKNLVTYQITDYDIKLAAANDANLF